MVDKLKLFFKELFAEFFFRYYPVTLSPLRVNQWLNTIIGCRDIDGDCVEIGVNLGGTAVFAKQMMNEMGINKKYYCYDTFSGFIEADAKKDTEKGMKSGISGAFRANSEKLVRKIFRIHGVGDIITVKGDIKFQERFPPRISACLIDVDLSDPTYYALKKVYPLMSGGGVIIIDDCYDEETMKNTGTWRAREGVSRFASEFKINPEYVHGTGIIKIP